MGRPDPQWVFVGGMIRSASTLQYQIARALVVEDLGGSDLGYREAHEIDAFLDATDAETGEAAPPAPRVVKSHACTPGIRARLQRGEAVAFYTHRDIRDVVVSGSRNFGVPVGEFIDGPLIDQAVGEYRLWTSCGRVSVSGFDGIMADPVAWAAEMAVFLGIEGDSAARGAELAERFSLDRQRERIKGAALVEKGGYAVDPDSLLHRNHIDRAASGIWRESLDEAQIREIELRSRDWLVEAGYAPVHDDGELPMAAVLAGLRGRTAAYLQESDRILQEREELLESASRDSEQLRSDIEELRAKLVESQPLRKWLGLHRRRLRNRLDKLRRPVK